MTVLRLVSGVEAQPDDSIAASFIALGESVLQGRLNIEQAIVVAVVDGCVTYSPIGHVTVVEGVGLLEMASRKIEQDATR